MLSTLEPQISDVSHGCEPESHDCDCQERRSVGEWILTTLVAIASILYDIVTGRFARPGPASPAAAQLPWRLQKHEVEAVRRVVDPSTPVGKPRVPAKDLKLGDPSLILNKIRR